ncbi:MAG: winged helix-turn-helix domain-containing protein, partial [Pseudomonadota bacterium]
MTNAETADLRSDTVLQAGDLTIDLSRHVVSRNGVALHLPPLSFRLLHALAARAPAVATADELLSTVWSGRVVGNETLTQRVKLLRDALGEDASQPQYIELVRGIGYRLAVPVTAAASASGDAATPAPASGRRRLIIAVGIAASVAAIAIATVPRLAPPSVPAPSVDEAAQRGDGHAAYLRARFFYDRRNEGDLTAAVRLFKEALQADPGNAKAWIGLASSYRLQALKADRSQKKRLVDGQRYALEQALALEPDSAAANIRYGRLLMLLGEVERGMERRRRGVSVEAMDPEALALQAGDLFTFGRVREAYERQRRSAELDPLSAAIHINLSAMARAVGELEVGRRALATAERLFATESYYERAHYAIAEGDYDEALVLAERVDEPRQRCEIQLLAQQQLATDAAAIDAAQRCVVADRSFTGEAVLATAAALQGDIEPAWRILDDMEVAAEHGAIDVKDWL